MTFGESTSDSANIGVACASLSCSASVTNLGSGSIVSSCFLLGSNLWSKFVIHVSKLLHSSSETVVSSGSIARSGLIISITEIMGFRFLTRFFGQLAIRFDKPGLEDLDLCSELDVGRPCVAMILMVIGGGVQGDVPRRSFDWRNPMIGGSAADGRRNCKVRYLLVVILWTLLEKVEDSFVSTKHHFMLH